jgi:hypothetical protein
MVGIALASILLLALEAFRLDSFWWSGVHGRTRGRIIRVPSIALHLAARHGPIRGVRAAVGVQKANSKKNFPGGLHLRYWPI